MSLSNEERKAIVEFRIEKAFTQALPTYLECVL